MAVLAIVHEDHDLLVVDKPAGLVCHPSKDGPLSSLIGRLRLHLEASGHAGDPPQLVNRLDRETSGLVVVAKSAAAARSLRRIWETRQVRKEYLALVQGHVEADHGLVDAPLGRDESSRVAIRDCVRLDGASARTDFAVLRRFVREGQPFTLLQVEPHTGRKHQIRIHLAHLGHAIVGDKIYGADEGAYLALVEGRDLAPFQAQLLLPHHALHARSVRFEWQGVPLAFACEAGEWSRWGEPA